MVQDDGPVGLDGVQVKFDDERVVSDAGLMLLATLAARLGIEEAAQRFVRLRPERPGAGNAGRKVMSLIFAMALGADSIDDCDVLRAGRTRRLLGGWVAAPSTLGTFLRAFTFGHVRQLDRLLAEALARAWQAGAGPRAARLTVDVDSFLGDVHGRAEQGAAFGYTHKRGYHPIVASGGRPVRCCTSGCARARRTRRAGCCASPTSRSRASIAPAATGPKLLRADSGFWSGKVFARPAKAGWQYSNGVRRQPHVRAAIEQIDEAVWQTLADYPPTSVAQIVEAEHRQHAVVELVIRDLKDQALAHFPSGHFHGNAAWTVMACLAHNLLRWTELLASPAPSSAPRAACAARCSRSRAGSPHTPAAGRCTCPPAGPGRPHATITGTNDSLNRDQATAARPVVD